jgi:hypothetical protein
MVVNVHKEMMRAAVLHGPMDVRMEEVPIP